MWFEKVQYLSYLGANLTHFGAKPTLPANNPKALNIVKVSASQIVADPW